MLDGPKSIISTALAIVTVLFILAVIGVVNQHVPMGMGAVGKGIGDIFTWAGELVGSL